MTGITGFLGMNLARKLTEEGHVVHALVRRSLPPGITRTGNIVPFDGDLDDRPAMEKAMKGCEKGFHLAGLAKPWVKDPCDFMRVNVEGSVNVFRAALETGLRKLVFTSSAATMSPSEGPVPADEVVTRKVPFFNAYEETKAAAECKALEYCMRGLHVVIVNPTRVYGPGPLNPSNSITKMIAGYMKGTWRIIPGDGRNIGNYVFINDVVHGHIQAAEKGEDGERYILGGENISFDELFRIVGEVLGKKRIMVHLPLAVMSSVAAIMEQQNRLTGIPPVITRDFVKKYLVHWSLSSRKAVNELGYLITPFREGVERTVKWLATT